MDDATRLGFDALIILSGVVLHCYLAYFKAGKFAVKAVKSWFLGEEGQIQLVTYLNNALDRKGTDGKSMADKLGALVLDKLLSWAESPQAAAVKDRFVDQLILRIKQWAGGMQTATGNKAKAGIDGAGLDLAAIIKQAIVTRVLASPMVQNLMGTVPPPPVAP